MGPHPGRALASHPSLLLPGPQLPKTQLILAINWKGLYFLDQKEKVLLELSFIEVMSLITNRWVLRGKPQTCSFPQPQSLGLQERPGEGWGTLLLGARLTHTASYVWHNGHWLRPCPLLSWGQQCVHTPPIALSNFL